MSTELHCCTQRAISFSSHRRLTAQLETSDGDREGERERERERESESARARESCSTGLDNCGAIFFESLQS